MNTRPSPKVAPISLSGECKNNDVKTSFLDHQHASFVLPTRKRVFKKVRFAPPVGKDSEADSKTVFATPHKELTVEMIRATWYSKQDIATFQKRSKLTILLRSKFPKFAAEHKINESSLGLDRFHPKRAAYKRAATKFTLQAQQKTKDPTFLAAVAKQCSSWARSAAFHQGLQNYCDVYNSKEDTTSLCAKVKLLQTQKTASLAISNAGNKGTKRSFEGKDEEPLQKRQRVAHSA